MNLEIRIQGVENPDEVRHYVEEQVVSSFGPFGDALLRVHVRIRDENGPKEGVDKSCHVTAVSRKATVEIDEVDGDEYAAASRAVDLAASSLRRVQKRARDTRARSVA
jgi:putative sigma-54 modulation protein